MVAIATSVSIVCITVSISVRNIGSMTIISIIIISIIISIISISITY